MVLETQLENPNGQLILDLKLLALVHTDHQVISDILQLLLEMIFAQFHLLEMVV